jgi:DNA-directed RNA polymerase specialized sigma24 family protein
VRISRREHEKGTWPLGHTSLDAPAAGELSLLEQLAAPAAEPTLEASLTGPALEQLVEQLPAAQATALRLTVLEGLSLRAAAAQLQISPMAVSHREVRLVKSHREVRLVKSHREVRLVKSHREVRLVKSHREVRLL